MTPQLICQCCNREPAVGVASVPGVPMSIAWCVPCLRSRAIPVWTAVAMVAQCGGWENMDEGYLDGIIAPTLFYFDIDIDDFLEQVTISMAEDAEFERQMAEKGQLRDDLYEIVQRFEVQVLREGEFVNALAEFIEQREAEPEIV